MGELGKEGSIFLVVGRMWLVLRMGKILASPKTPSSSSVLPQAVQSDAAEKRYVAGKIDESWAPLPRNLMRQRERERNYSVENGITKCQKSLACYPNNSDVVKKKCNVFFLIRLGRSAVNY
jgi:hypothetical protein